MIALPPSPRSIAARRVFADGAFIPATVHLEARRIAAIGAFDDHADLVIDDAHVLLPGLVDSHVHLDEPGRTQWEGFATGTAAAVAGGVATVFDMPLNSVPVTTTTDALAAKRAAAAGKIAADVGYWGGAVPGNLGDLAALHEAGVVGFKCFLAPSGIDEFGHLDAAQLTDALGEIAQLGSILIVHAEDPAHLHADGPLGPHYPDFLASRPGLSERAAIRSVIAASRATGGRAHIVHVSDAGSLDDVRAAKAEGVPLSIETCPHYLTLTAEEVPDGAGAFKCCPPIRGAANRDSLWEAVLDGTVDAIVSDHSPSTPDLKSSPDFGLTWGGIAGVQTGFVTVWTEARRRGVPLERIVPLFTTGPAGIAGYPHRGTPRSGRLRGGMPAHLVVFDPGAEWTVRADDLEYRNKISPWDGRTVAGRVEATYVNGVLAYSPSGGVTARAGREILAEVTHAEGDA